MAEFISGIKDKLNVLLAFHSYSQLLLSPYGHSSEVVPYNHKDLMQVAKAYADAVQALPYGTIYQYGTSAGLLYPASGATLDWAYNEQYIRISYTIEFRDTGKFGFVIPPAYIIPNAEENLIASATWMINQLLSSADKQVREMAESHDWYIVPVLNVDGFVYSHEKDRLWRKTRQPSAISSCIGVDPNRNYDSYWMVNGASNDPCEWTYAGPHALSEPEIKAMSDFVSSIKDKLNVMLAFHSYSQLLLSPFGHTDEEVPENYDDLMQVAKAYADAVQALPYGTVYQYGSSAGLLYPASGATLDWAYNEQYIRISYTIEFRDTGKFGFVIPPAYIIPNAEENLIGIVALLAEAKKLGYLKLKY
ncbi:CG7025 [Drosophila busckii]|uniref:CG7025 n=1 Tax=Drosophila busckii TaxID=30019 RepID=A0A0M4E4S3_DROBS|nr:CG7025 [Drosophila busckii]